MNRNNNATATTINKTVAQPLWFLCTSPVTTSSFSSSLFARRQLIGTPDRAMAGCRQTNRPDDYHCCCCCHCSREMTAAETVLRGCDSSGRRRGKHVSRKRALALNPLKREDTYKATVHSLRWSRCRLIAGGLWLRLLRADVELRKRRFWSFR